MSDLVSIIIPCYNAERWIAQTLESALAQTWKHTEIIVIDDGSKDRSTEVARGFASRGVQLIIQENRGASAARNRGLQSAKGRYIQFLDADDILASDKIALQVPVLQAAGDEYLASGEWARFTDKPEEAKFADYPNYRDLSGVEFLQIFFEKIAMMQPGSWLSPRVLLDRAGPWDEQLSLNDDGEYFARVVLTAQGIRFCPGSRVYYRSNIAGSLSGKRGPKYYRSLFKANESITRQLLERDRSARTLACVAYSWKWAAFELYPDAPELSAQAWELCQKFGGSDRDFLAGQKFQRLAKLVGWRFAKRLRNWRLS